jgi:hypothetical protein
VHPVADLQCGRWPGRASRWFALGGLTLIFGGLTVAAWVAVFQGHPEALFLGTLVPAMVYVIVFRLPISAARLSGDELSLPHVVLGVQRVPLGDVTTMRAGRWRSPLVVFEVPGRRPVRWWVSGAGEPLLAALRPMTAPSADRLPDGVRWLSPRRTVWFVAGFFVEVADSA